MKPLRLLFCLLMLAAVAPFVPASAASETGRYVVSLNKDRDPRSTASEHRLKYGAKADRYYTSAIKGYSAVIPNSRIDELRADPSVRSVTKNYAFRAAAQTLPTGVDRVQADVVPGTGEGVQVAILDSGIDYTHSDLAANVLGGVDCDGPDTGNYLDGNGHGTHVAGILAAVDNTEGVVGVAPQAKLWAVRILNNAGAGDLTSILCGLDWVDARTPAKVGNNNPIKVANMSIEADIPDADDGACGSIDGDPVHDVICSIVAGGTTMTVAAGNFTDNIKDIAPAAYDEVIAVTALVDSDGGPCSLGSDPLEPDDTFAGFSSYATGDDQAHTLGAPGAYDILSTVPGGYGLNTGTSMAAPHVAGAAARYLQTHPSALPSEVLNALRTNAEPKNVDFNDECPGTTASHTDPSGLHPEPVVRVVDWEIDIEVTTPGIVRGNRWFLNNGFDGNADVVFDYGSSTDKIVVGDWNGDGVDTPGIVRGNVWYLNDSFDSSGNVAPFAYGSATDRPIVGDWDDDGDDTPGVVRGNVWYLNNDHDPSSNVPPFAYGSATDKIIAGDWDGDGRDTPGIIRGNVWYLNDNFDPNAYKVFGFGSTTDVPVAGDWVGDGIDRPGLHRGNKWFLNLGFDPFAEVVFPYGLVSDRFVVGDWDGENP